MLVVKVELWNGGEPTEAFEIGRMGVINVANGGGKADYAAVTCSDGESKDVMLTDHRRADGVWALLARLAAAQAEASAPLPAALEEKLREVEQLMFEAACAKSLPGKP